MNNFRFVRKLNADNWANFVYNHPNGNIFQTPEMYEVYKNTKNYEPVFIAVIDEKDDILGLLLAVIQKEYSGFLGNLTARSIIYGGPLIKDNNPDVLDFILKEYDKIIKRKAIYSQLRNIWDWGELKSLFINNEFNYEDHLDIIVNLKKSKDELWENVNTKRRNQIRNAIKSNIIFSIKTEINDLKQCYEILKKVYNRAKLPLPAYSFFENILKSSNENFGLKLFCSEYEKKIIGCMFGLIYKSTIYDFYAGAYQEFYSKHPNDLIPWSVFLWGKNNGFERFDFGGAGKPDKPYGVRDYKLKFGGELVNWGRFEKVHKPLLMHVGKIGLKVWQKLK